MRYSEHPSLWREIERVFHEALSYPRSERAAFLEELTQSRQRVKREVLRLLRDHGRETDFLKVTDHSLLPFHSTEAQGPKPGDRFGAFRLVRCVGSGGMGTVWLGERADEEFEQRVAIKLMRARLGAHSQVRHRFEQERRTLARFEHPNIVRLIDGGTTDEGQPYLIMEFVEGRPLTHYCRDENLDANRRLALFRHVCEAVDTAHQNLVVHRDLKPGNILVSANGVPKLLDFGISRFLDQRDSQEESESSSSSPAPLTPRYASPEQKRGQPLSTASDVYSLGLVLYELLTDQVPPEQGPEPLADPEDQDRDSASRIFPDPSRSSGLHFGSDLDRIVRRALDPRPAHRYSSAEQLREEIDRYLNGYPVLATQRTLRYRAEKWIRRNRALAASLGLGMVCLFLGALGTLTGWSKARNDRDEAIRVTRFLQDVIVESNPYRTRDGQNVLSMLALAEEKIEKKLADHPAAEADVRESLARAYGDGLWRWDEALPHARKAYELKRTLYGDEHLRVIPPLTLLAKCLTHLRKTEAVDFQRHALHLNETHYGKESPQVAQALTGLAFSIWHASSAPEKWKEAEELHRRGIELYRQCPGTDPRQLAVALHLLGGMFVTDGRSDDETKRVHEEALSLYRSLPEQKDRFMAECLRSYSYVLRRQGLIFDEERTAEEYLAMTPDFCSNECHVRGIRARLEELRQN